MSDNTGRFRRPTTAVTAGSKRGGRARRRAWDGGRHRLRPVLSFLEERCLLSATYTVTSTDDSAPANNPTPGTLRWAVQQANATSGGATIDFNLSTPTTITLAQGLLELRNITAGTIVIDGPGAGNLTISGGGHSNVFVVDLNQSPTGALTAMISGLTIAGGSVSGNGGGVFNRGSMALTDCTLSGNTATADGGALDNTGQATLIDCTLIENTSGPAAGIAHGGGLANEQGATLALTGCTISGNTAGQTGRGGGLFNAGTTTLAGCTISGNTAAGSGFASQGGGLDNDFGGMLSLTGCTISGNNAYIAGGLQNSFQATANLTNCTIDGNNAADYGGGLDSAATLNLTACTISGNSAAARGGGGASLYGNATLINCTLTGNYAAKGGALDNYGTAQLTACTISGNASPAGAGLYNEMYGYYIGHATLTDTIVAGNSTPGNAASDIGGAGASFVIGSYNLIGTGGSGGITGGSNGNLVGSDPNLGSLADNGGPTQTMALLSGSPAIGAGTSVGAPSTDERGLPRPGGSIDIGAFQTQAVPDLPPIAAHQEVGAVENAALHGQVSATDPDNDPLTYSGVANPAHGTLALNGDGSFTYTPAANFIGVDSFTFRASDGIASSNVATVSIVVSPGSPAPLANNDTYTVAPDTTLSVAAPGVLANDHNSIGGPLTAVLVVGPSDGTLALNDDGSFTYTPTTGFSGTDSFTYQASNGQALSNAATVSIIVGQPPTANDDSYSTHMNIVLTIAAPGVLANDSDPKNLPLTAVLVTGTSHGFLNFNSDGSFSYFPTAGSTGTDSFTYQVSDGQLLSRVATVTLDVFAWPVANNAGFATNENSVLIGQVTGMDPDGEPVTYHATSFPTHGSLALQPDGSFTYTPDSYYFGPDGFSFQVTDGQVFSNVATASITVNRVDLPPVAHDDAYTVASGSVLTAQVGQTFVTMNSQPGDSIGQGKSYDFTPTDSTITARVIQNTGIFTNTVEVDVTAPGQSWALDFQAPNQAQLMAGIYNGATRWPFEAAGTPGLDVNGDGRGANAITGQFTVTQATYDASGNIVSFGASFVLYGDGSTAALTGQVAFNFTDNHPNGVLFNDFAPNPGTTLSAIEVTGPSDGTLALDADGSFTYTPDAGFIGTDSFTYKANDGIFDSDVATVTITVTPPPPVVNNDSYSTNEDVALSVAAPGVLANDSDPRDLPLTAVLVAGPAHGTLALNGDGSFTYTPAANFLGTDSFTYQAGDGQAVSDVATVGLTVGQTPTAQDDAYIVEENASLVAGAGPNDLIMASQPGDPIGLGQTYDFTPADSTITAYVQTGAYPNTVEVDVNTGAQIWSLIFQAPDQGQLVPGVYNYATRWPFQQPGTPGMEVDGSSGGVTETLNGQFTVTEATYDVFGNITSFAASFVQYSNGSSAALTGQVAYNSTNPQPDGVLANDSDPNTGTTLSAIEVSAPSHGTLALNPDGSFLYTPTPGYFGTDTFTYKATDGIFDSNVATVTITVAAPVANDDSYTMTSNTTLSVDAPGVLANDASPFGSPLTFVLVSGPAHGTLSIASNGDGSFAYLPTTNFVGTDTFTYEATDGIATSAPAIVTINVLPPSRATLIRTDTTTEGSWIGTYGAQGYDIVGRPADLPRHDTITPSGQSTLVWSHATDDPRALQFPHGSARIAEAWYSASSFRVDVNLADGQAHGLELYLLDWDSNSRVEQVQVSDYVTGAVLSTRTVSSFHSGVYLDYLVGGTGHIVITITRMAGANAVLSGLFLDPATGGAARVAGPGSGTSVGPAAAPGTSSVGPASPGPRAAAVVDPAGKPTGRVPVPAAARGPRPDGSLLIAASRRLARRPAGLVRQPRPDDRA